MKRRRIPKGTKPILFIVLVLYVVITIKISDLYSYSQELESQEKQIQQQIQLELEKSERLRQEEAYMHSKEYIEELAREKLGLIKPDEILMVPNIKE